jgi:poly(3-hydroxybutyrate) depolymerase
MNIRPFAVLAPVVLVGALVGAQSPSAPAGADSLDEFVQAPSQGAAETAASRVGKDVPFDVAWRRLKTGRLYKAERTGRAEMPTADYGARLDNVLEVPAEYAPTRAWPLRVSLHGGVGRQAPGSGDEPARPLANRIAGGAEFVLHPRAWAQSEWWTWGQVQNIAALVDRVKRRYNIDESSIYLTGISDGGTGAYFLAMRSATLWAACLPLNGHPSVLANPDVGADGQLYAGNLVNCPLRAVNGGRDRLYPAASVAPLIEMFRRGGIPVEWQVYPEAGHDVSWWPVDRAKYEAFLSSHARVAHPARVSWETERVDRYNRFRWVVVTQLGSRPSDQAFEDVNRFVPAPNLSIPLYDRSKPSGRVDAMRSGNAIELKTRGIREVSLLLSPDAVDLDKPVAVTVNGRQVHNALVPRDTTTLLKWAARDNDRTMLYGAELRVSVP